ncbi:MAG TPA: response regulator [Thermoanaerobaculia bacterium]|jgi:CheY-like chemotaxis protein
MDATRPLSPLRLLIIDDDEAIQTLMKALFRRANVVIDSAGDGEAGLRKIRHQHYDAILLDLMLPLVNGFEVIREIKSRDLPTLRHVVVLTAASDRTLRDFRDGGLVRRVMRKPFDMEDLMDEVLACASARDTSAEARVH